MKSVPTVSSGDRSHPVPLVLVSLLCVSDLLKRDLILVSFQIRLYARPNAIASGAGDYALHITKRLLGFYQDYFKVQYSLPKLGKAAARRWRSCDHI